MLQRTGRGAAAGVTLTREAPSANPIQEAKTMKPLKSMVALALALLLLAPASVFASSHREAPITALDRTADITDWYAFVSYDNPNNVTFILNVDPFLEPANGPNYFPFDPNVLYQMKIDNNRDGIEDVTFQFRFTTGIRRSESAPDLHRHHAEKRRADLFCVRPANALRRAVQRRPADHAQLPGA